MTCCFVTRCKKHGDNIFALLSHDIIGISEQSRKLTFKEQKELDALPKRIAELESEHEKMLATMTDPDFYRKSGSKVSEYTSLLEAMNG